MYIAVLKVAALVAGWNGKSPRGPGEVQGECRSSVWRVLSVEYFYCVGAAVTNIKIEGGRIGTILRVCYDCTAGIEQAY